MNLPMLKQRYMKAKVSYYESGNPIMTDAAFDALEDRIAKQDPKWKELKKTGTKVGKKVEVPLLYAMPSLDKIHAEKQALLDRFLARYEEVVLMPKLDGSSVQLVYEGGKAVRLITRGDGVLGKEISFFLPHLKQLPTIKAKVKIVLRCEAVMDNRTWEKKWKRAAEGSKIGFDSARNQVSGVLNRQDVHDSLTDIRFVVLRVQNYKGPIDAGLDWVKGLVADSKGLSVVSFKRVPVAKVTTESLTKLLGIAKEKTPFDLDGLVIHSINRNLAQTTDKPKYAKAWKLNDLEAAIKTTVVAVHWQVSRHGVLVPKIEVEPVQVQGAKVRFATANNAAWAQERGVGPGAVVTLLRSGEIIPKIIEVLQKSRLTLPNAKEVGDYEWDKNKTHLVLKKAHESTAVKAKRIARFYSMVGAEFLGEGVAKKMVAAGFSTVEKAAQMTRDQFAKLDGFGAQSATRAHQSLKSVYEAQIPLTNLMIASGVFPKGVGTTFLNRLIETDPALVYKSDDYDEQDLADALIDIPGLTYIFVEGYTKNVARFWAFQEKTGVPFKPYTKLRTIKGPLTGKSVSWTGYRSPEQEAWVKSLGGSVISFSAKTDVLLYAANGKASSKVEKAKAAKIKTWTFEALQRFVVKQSGK